MLQVLRLYIDPAFGRREDRFDIVMMILERGYLIETFAKELESRIVLDVGLYQRHVLFDSTLFYTTSGLVNESTQICKG